MRKFAHILGLLLLASPAWAGIKENQHLQMIDLAQQMHQLKASGQAGSAQYLLLRGQYEQLSAAMGGDDPGRNLPDGQPAVDGQGPNDPIGGTIGVIPSAPVGCSASTVLANQAAPTPIVDVGVASSTVVVAGAGPFLWDLNLETFITHSFAADMDITLQSPAGTVVTLSTDNGAGNDDVYNGTVWDDQANPAGQVPYVTNNGLATDHAYANLTLASPLVPEEAMGAFVGEDPNGTWTITISDDLGGDTGNLASWTLEVTSLSAAPTVANTVAAQATPTPIVDVGVSTSTLIVAGAGTSILDVDLTTSITHTFAADMDITIESPAGTVVTLSTDNGAGNDDVFNGTVWNDDANPAGQVPYVTNNGLASDHAYVNLTLASPLVPEEAMAAFIGEDPNGTWTITVSDDLGGDVGSIASWSLDIDTLTCGCTLNLTCPADIATETAPGDTDVAVNFPAPTVGGSCTSVSTVCVPASGDLFPVGVTPVNCTATDSNTGETANCGFNVTVGGVSILEIPTASSIGLAALALLLAATAFLVLRRS